MGADFLIAAMYIQKDKEPDWDAGLKALEGLQEDEENNPLPSAEDIEDLKSAFQNSYRDAALIHVGEYNVLVSGGLSWGEDPTRTFSTICTVNNYPQVWKAMGFLE